MENKIDREFSFKSNKPLKKTHLELFDRMSKMPDSGPIREMLLILCTPRCGSTLFADALYNSGQVGLCEEWLNYEYFAAYMEVLGCKFSLREYLNWIARKSVGNTGVMAFKVHIAQLISMYKDFDFGIGSLNFNHVVYLSRLNKIAQAVSLAKAIKTNQFRHNEEPQNDAVIGMHDITHALGVVTEQDEYFWVVLNEYKNDVFYYEDFLNLNHSSYNKVLKALGKQPQEKFKTSLVKQANQKSKELERTFKSYIGVTQ